MAVRLARHWWALALRGVLAILFGIVALAQPDMAVEAVVMLFGAYVLVDGVFALVAALLGGWFSGRWAGLLLEGVLGVVLGILTLLHPTFGLTMIVYFIAFWALLTGFLEISVGLNLRSRAGGGWSLILAGVVSILFAVALVVQPEFTARAMMQVMGIYALVFGVILLILAFRLRAWSRHGRTLGPM